MLMPAKVKYRKQQKGRRRGTASRGADLSFGDYGLQALEPGWLTARQIEASRVAVQRHVKRGGELWIRGSPDKPVTKKPADTSVAKATGELDTPMKIRLIKKDIARLQTLASQGAPAAEAGEAQASRTTAPEAPA